MEKHFGKILTKWVLYILKDLIRANQLNGLK